jgi:hypothetical protein
VIESPKLQTSESASAEMCRRGLAPITSKENAGGDDAKHFFGPSLAPSNLRCELSTRPTVRVDSYVQEFGVNSVRTIGLALDYNF